MSVTRSESHPPVTRSLDELVARAEEDGDEREKLEFYREFDHHVLHLKNQNNERYVVKEPVYQLALRALRLPHEQCTPEISVRFKHWVNENFRIEVVKDQDVLYCKKRNLPIVTYDKLYAVIRGCHVVTGHHGRDKTWSEVSNNFAWVPYKAIRLYLGMCSVCKSRNPALKRPLPPHVRSPRPPRVPAPGKKPAIPVGFMMRLQVDFLDMSRQRDGEQQWIVLVRDTFSEYSWAQPLAAKEVGRVSRMLYDIFIMFGPCRILQSEEGDGFVRDLIANLLTMWDGLFIIVGRVQQGLQAALYSGQSDFVQKLYKWLETNTSNWTVGLPRIVHAVNTSPSTRIGVSPYEIVFDQRPHATYQGLDALSKSDPLHEEDLSADMLQFLSQAHDGKVSKKAARKAQGPGGLAAAGYSYQPASDGQLAPEGDEDLDALAAAVPDDNYFLFYKGVRVAKVMKREGQPSAASDDEEDEEDDQDDELSSE